MKRNTLRLAALAIAGCVLAAGFTEAQIRDPLEVQKGRDAKLQKRGSVSYYSERWDLSALPAYEPHEAVSGVIRQWGTNYFSDSPLEQTWEEGFRKFHPDVHFETDLKTALAAIPALTFKLADIGPARHITSDETLLFQRYRSYLPTQITVVTGSLNVPGWSYAIGIFVNKDNPLSKLTIEQLDGIFGAERSGAFRELEWNTAAARSPEKNIRTWGQLGPNGTKGSSNLPITRMPTAAPNSKASKAGTPWPRTNTASATPAKRSRTREPNRSQSLRAVEATTCLSI